MRISTKIYILTVVLFLTLAASFYSGTNQLNKIRQEFQSVAESDVALMDFVLTLEQYQSQKTILFERLLRVTEELEDPNISPARKEHLLDLAKMIKDGFIQLRQKTGESIIEVKALLQSGMRSIPAKEQQQYIAQIQQIFADTEKSEIAYEDFLISMAQSVQDEKFQLSMGDIDQAQSRERKLSKQFNDLIERVHQLTKQSLVQATGIEKRLSIMMKRILLGICIGLIIIILIIRGVTRPLHELTKAVHQVGEGNFNLRLKDSSRDEIGEINRALNIMSAKLSEAREQLEKKNEELAEQLTLTRQQKFDLEKINKELDNFAHTVSHDLRSPLMGIMSYCSILENQYRSALDERGQKCINRIRHGSVRLNQMIDDLLALTRISRIKNPYEYTDITRVVKDVIDRLEVKIGENHVEMVIAENLPEIYGDRIKLGEVFLNLISNGIKFSSKRDEKGQLVSGQHHPKIEVGYRDAGSEHEFSVKDNGIGIAKENQEVVFDIFKRLDTAEQYEGTGAGLSIVKTVIDDHGGKIWIDSDIGRGAAFYFTIPKNLQVS